MKTPIRIAMIMGVICAFAAAQSCTVGTNRCLRFAGDDLVRVASSATLDGFSDFTIECWARFDPPSGSPEGDMLITKWRHGAPSDLEKSFAIRRLPDRRLLIQLAVGANPSIDRSPAATLVDHLWHHIVVTRSVTTVNVFLNGVAIDSYACNGPLNHCAAPLAIGAIFDPSDMPLANGHHHGYIDEVRIWNVGRSAAEIVTFANSMPPLNAQGLVSLWRFDEAFGQSVVDLGPALNHGTLGMNLGIAGDDPNPEFFVTPPLLYCAPSVGGNANTAAARLEINGAGFGNSPGPFVAMVATTGAQAGQLSFSWTGPPSKPLVLAYGNLAPGNMVLGGTGILDLQLSSIGILFDGTQMPSAWIFSTGLTGTASQVFTIPVSLPLGPLLNVQGVVMQDSPQTPWVLTAAFQIVMS